MSNPVFGDIKSRGLMIFKAILFVFTGIFSGGLLILEESILRRAVLLAVCVWAFCRAYYFAFYVIAAYLDPDFKYSGILSAVRHLLRKEDFQNSGSQADSTRNDD